MAEELITPQRIDAKYDENAILALSRAQNDGAASLVSVQDTGGNLIGYDSRYAIALEADGSPSGYAAAQLNALVTTRDSLYVRIDADAEQERLKLITPGAGQAMEYQEAQAEATRALAALAADPDAKLDPVEYPMLSSSIGYDVDPTTGKPTTDVAGEARSVDQARKQFLYAGSAIRKTRLDAKSAIEQANSVVAMQNIYNSIQWPKFG